MKTLIKIFSGTAAFFLMLQTAIAQQAATTPAVEGPSLGRVPDFFFDLLFYFWLLLGSILILVFFTFIKVIKVLSKLVLAKQGITELPEELKVQTKTKKI